VGQSAVQVLCLGLMVGAVSNLLDYIAAVA